MAALPCLERFGKLLDIRPGDYLLYVLETRSVRLFKATGRGADGPFQTFFEWASKEDEDAYADL